MSNVFTSDGTKYYTVAALPATYDTTGFDALAWVAVGEVTDVGEFGATFETVTHNPLATRNTVKRKGSYNNGAVTLQMGRDITDAGQALLKSGATGADMDKVFSHKVEYLTGEIDYFTGPVFSFVNNVGAANNIVGHTATVELDNDVVTKAGA